MGEPNLLRTVVTVQNGLFEVHATGEIYRNTKHGRKKCKPFGISIEPYALLLLQKTTLLQSW